MTFGDDLRKQRVSAGLSQAELAGDRCSLSYISHLESGRRAPTPELVRYLEDQLNLAPGNLGRSLTSPTSHRPRRIKAELFSDYLAAVGAWRSGAFGRALQLATQLQHQLEDTNSRPDLRALTFILLIDINIDLGHYENANQLATASLEDARSTGSPTLEARAACMKARTSRLCGAMDASRDAAQLALHLTSFPDIDPHVRAEALRAAIASSSEAGNEPRDNVEQLNEILPDLEDEHERGLSAWVLGITALRSGDVPTAMRWHDEAFKLLSPAADLRNWARFPRVVAQERIRVGVLEGVVDMLTEAETRLRLLDSPDEIATLSIVRARYLAGNGATSEALTCIASALEEDDLPAMTSAQLLLVAAEVHQQNEDSTAANTAALTAARMFTEAGDIPRAQQAWRLTS